MSRFSLPCVLFGGVVICSCSTMETLTTATTDGLQRVGQSISGGTMAVVEAAKSPFAPPIPIAQPRPQDFRNPQTGREQALAYEAKRREQQQRRSIFSFFKGPVDFQEPALPEEGDWPVQGGLLLPEKQ